MDLESARETLRRRAIRFEIGGFRPPDDPLASWFGHVGFAARDEGWPSIDGRPMTPLCQLNLVELPFRPPRMEDFDFMTVFAVDDPLPDQDANGTTWCIRTYPDLDDLIPLARTEGGAAIKAFPMRPSVIEADYPKWDDVDIELDPDVEDAYYDHFDTADGLKLGGWPSLIQSEISWAPWNRHPAAPEFVFQIDSEDKANWSWGDAGVGYFGRGTASGHEDEWTFEWQCY